MIVSRYSPQVTEKTDDCSLLCIAQCYLRAIERSQMRWSKWDLRSQMQSSHVLCNHKGQKCKGQVI